MRVSREREGALTGSAFSWQSPEVTCAHQDSSSRGGKVGQTEPFARVHPERGVLPIFSRARLFL